MHNLAQWFIDFEAFYDRLDREAAAEIQRIHEENERARNEERNVRTHPHAWHVPGADGTQREEIGEGTMDTPYTFTEIVDQKYKDTRLSAGLVYNHPVDTIYLRFERDGEEPTTIVLRVDEALAIVHLLSGALWSHAMSEIVN